MAISRNKVLVFITALILWGCSFDYNEEGGIVEKADSIPDSSMTNFRMVTIKNNSPSTEINASRAQIYNEKEITILENIEFIEYQDSLEITNGKARKGEYYNDSKNAKITGDIVFYSRDEDLEIFGEELIWDDENNIIKSSKNIKVIKGDGSEIEGVNFEAKLKEKTFTFSGPSRGFVP